MVPAVNIKHEIEPNNEVKKIAKDLREAFHCKKAVFLVNHTISKEDENKVYSLIRKFSALPNPIKEKYKSIIKTGYHGYTSQQSERINKEGPIEFKESYNIIGYNRYLPDEEISEFSKTIDTITEKLLNISNILLQLFAISLELSLDFFLPYHENMFDHLLNRTTLRILNYPPVNRPSSHISDIIRCGEHTDYGTFSLIMQDSEGGLEIIGSDGKWKRVGHIPGAMLILTAFLFEVLTSGKYKATLHRVIVPEEEEVRNKSRNSMVFFVTSDEKSVIKPLFPTPEIGVKEYITGEYLMEKLNEIKL